MTKLETLKVLRLEGKTVDAGSVVEIDDELAKRWIKLGFARVYTAPVLKERPKPKSKARRAK